MVRTNLPSPQRNRRTANVAGAALLAVGTMCIVGCVSSGRYNQIEQERDLLQARYETLKDEAESAKLAGEALAQEKAMLAQEKNALATEKTALEEKLALLKSQEDSLGTQLKARDEEARRLQRRTTDSSPISRKSSSLARSRSSSCVTACA